MNNRIGEGSEGDLLAAGRDSFRCPATVIPAIGGRARTIAYPGKYSRREEKK